MGRNDQTDAARKGPGAKSVDKDEMGAVMDPYSYRGDWLGAYGGGLGSPSDRTPDSDGDTDGN